MSVVVVMVVVLVVGSERDRRQEPGGRGRLLGAQVVRRQGLAVVARAVGEPPRGQRGPLGDGAVLGAGAVDADGVDPLPRRVARLAAPHNVAIVLASWPSSLPLQEQEIDYFLRVVAAIKRHCQQKDHCNDMSYASNTNFLR